MAITTLYGTENGVRRLLAAHLDLDQYSDWPGTDRSLSTASADERELFDGYVLMLRQMYELCEPWWESTIAAQQINGRSREEAVEAAFLKRLAGPASHPSVVWVIRAFWLDRAKQNQRMPPDQWVRPEIVLLQWLIDAGETELVRLVACMPYWPIGLDESGNWC